MKARPRPDGFDHLAITTISAALLAFEIILLRVYSYSQWHHFASFAVALALLGLGCAGTVLALLGQRAVRYGDWLFIGGIMLGACGMLLALTAPHFVSVRPLFALWDGRELGKLLLLDFLAFIPFFGLALSIGQVFMRWPRWTARLYGMNLLGSGMGCFLAVILLDQLFLERALGIIPIFLFLLATALVWLRAQAPRLGIAGLVVCFFMFIWLLVGLSPLPVSDFKQLAYILDLPDSQITDRRPGMQADVTLVRSDSLRIAPGLSFQWHQAIPSREVAILAADQVLPLQQAEFTESASDYLEATLGSIPCRLRPHGPVAILGTSNWIFAPLLRNRPVTQVESNPDVLDLIRRRGFSPQTKFIHASPRVFSEISPESSFTLLILSVAAMEKDAVSEDYLLTVEGLESSLSLVQPDGILAIPMRLANPPRHVIRMMTILRSILENRVVQPERHVALVRSMQDALILVSTTPFSSSDIEQIRTLANRWSFDLSLLPGLKPSEINRFHKLDSPVYHDAAMALFSGVGEMPSEASWYDLSPATDLRPYFWKSMRWSTLPALLHEFGRQGMIWLDWAIIMATAKVVLAGILAGLLILLPLRWLPPPEAAWRRFTIWMYFSMLGLGYLLLEMAVFQRSVLYLNHPVETAALVFSIFLIGSGIGSFMTPDISPESTFRHVFLPILGGAVFTMVFLELCMLFIFQFPPWQRCLILAAGLFPLGWALGRAFPWALRRLNRSPAFIPWAWGINGFASVLAAPLAALLSVQFGQLATGFCGFSCYLMASLVARKLP